MTKHMMNLITTLAISLAAAVPLGCDEETPLTREALVQELADEEDEEVIAALLADADDEAQGGEAPAMEPWSAAPDPAAQDSCGAQFVACYGTCNVLTHNEKLDCQNNCKDAFNDCRGIAPILD
jgi:hypothetical protein